MSADQQAQITELRAFIAGHTFRSTDFSGWPRCIACGYIQRQPPKHAPDCTLVSLLERTAPNEKEDPSSSTSR